MSAFTFTKAVKSQEKLRMALDGPAGSGKTWTSLVIGSVLAEKEGGRIALMDSERSSAKKYATYFDFDHLTLPDFNPHTYIKAMRAAIDAGYAVLIIDSLSHAWEGTLDLKDAVARRSTSKDSFGAWREVTPVHNELVDTMLRAPLHVIATMRVETEYVVDPTNEDRSKRVQKIGLKPMQRKGVDFEFDVVADMDQENTLVVSKTRCHDITGAVIRRPDSKLADTLWAWLSEGEPAAPDAYEWWGGWSSETEMRAEFDPLFDRYRQLSADARGPIRSWAESVAQGWPTPLRREHIDEFRRLLDETGPDDPQDPDPGPGRGTPAAAPSQDGAATPVSETGGPPPPVSEQDPPAPHDEVAKARQKRDPFAPSQFHRVLAAKGLKDEADRRAVIFVVTSGRTDRATDCTRDEMISAFEQGKSAIDTPEWLRRVRDAYEQRTAS